jgi:hypothetical protein
MEIVVWGGGVGVENLGSDAQDSGLNLTGLEDLSGLVTTLCMTAKVCL